MPGLGRTCAPQSFAPARGLAPHGTGAEPVLRVAKCRVRSGARASVLSPDTRAAQPPGPACAPRATSLTSRGSGWRWAGISVTGPRGHGPSASLIPFPLPFVTCALF